MNCEWTMSVVLVLLHGTSFSQSVSTQMSARNAAMGNASATLHDEWSMLNNPGGLGKIDNGVFSYAHELRPALEGANRMGAVVALPLREGVIGLSVFKFGDILYSEHVVSFGYGHRIGITSLGIKANYIQYHTEGFGTHTTVGFDFGGITNLTSKLTVGSYIINLTQAKLNAVITEHIPTFLVTGIGYDASANVKLVAEIEKDLLHEKPQLRAGMEYNFKNKFFARTGFSLHPNAGYVGIGLQKNKIKIDYAIGYSPVLLYYYQAAIGWIFYKAYKE